LELLCKAPYSACEYINCAVELMRFGLKGTRIKGDGAN
jgi:hypothetical protein